MTPIKKSRQSGSTGLYFGISLVLVFVSGCSNASPDTSTPTALPISLGKPTDAPPILATPQPVADLSKNIPLLAERQKRIDTALKSNNPILPLSEADALNEFQKIAQDLALRDPKIQKESRDPVSQLPVRYEVMGIYPTRDSDLNEQTASCKQAASCYRIELYNYAFNYTMIAIADVGAKKVLSVNRLADAQPDISPSLTKLATQIAVNAPEVAQALGYKPGESEAVMPNVKTSLNRTRCERSRHLCVAPTFVQGERALWAIVDLTENQLVGVRWTDVGRASRPAAVTEKLLQNDFVSSNYCRKDNPLSRNDWEMAFTLTSSDGMRVSNLRYKGKSIASSIKLVDWHVSYSRQDGFGYSDAIGCPVFSQAAVVAIGGPAIEDMKSSDGATITGFALVQDFLSDLWPAACNYYYRQRYEFYNDGRFRVVAGNLGRGCGNDGTYRPVIRIALAGEQNTFAHFDGSTWQDWPTEGWKLFSDSKVDSQKNQYRISNGQGAGFLIEPNRGQFGDGSRGDNEFVFITRLHADKDEGETDLITIGPCCNTDYKQGPEKFIDPTPEPVKGTPLVLWYVPQIKNDNTPGKEYCWAESVLTLGVYEPKVWPCYAGPMFKPF